MTPGIRKSWSGLRGVPVSFPLPVLRFLSQSRPAFRLSLSLPRVRVVPKRSVPHVAPLLFSCRLRLLPCTPRQSKLRPGKPFGGRGRSLRTRDIPPAPAPVPARVPAMRICDRTPRCAHRALRAPARTAPFATPRAPHRARHRGKPQPLLLRTHRPAVSASPSRRFSPPRAPTPSPLPPPPTLPPLPNNLLFRPP